jgi:hypothetical protein
MASAEEFEQKIVGGQVPGFDTLVSRFTADYFAEEKQRRHIAYERLGETVTRLLPEGMSSETLHVDYFADEAQRTVFICRDRVPAHGELVRIIINDEQHDVLEGSCALNSRDFVISATQKALSFQQSWLARRRDAHGWQLQATSAPLLVRRYDRLEVLSGSKYQLHIPKTRGYPHSIGQLIEHRVLLESVTDDLARLNGVTQQDACPSARGIMS